MKHVDKLLHLAAGAAMTVLVGLVHPIAGAAACLLLAWAKEEHDRDTPGHTRDGWDAYATAAGIVPGQLVLSIPALPGPLLWQLIN